MIQKKGGSRLHDVLESMRILKKIDPELRAKHEKEEPLEEKFARWQKIRVPELALEQRPSNPEWTRWFEGEAERVSAALGDAVVRIEHFGSTSVPGLASKNIIDMAVALAGEPQGEQIGALEALGYENYGNSPLGPTTLWLWRIEDDRAFIAHLCDHRRPWIGESLATRDYLRAHPGERDRYAELKRELARERGHSFLQYSISKMALWIELIDNAEAWQAGLNAKGEPSS